MPPFSTPRAVHRLYRSLLNYSKSMAPESEFRIRPCPEKRPWGTHVFTETGPAYQRTLLERLMPGVEPPHEMLNAELYKQIVRSKFRDPARGSPTSLGASIDEGFYALRRLGEQVYLNSCSSSHTTEGVQVDATSSFERIQMTGLYQHRYVFSYILRIINNREHPVQVIGRSWTMQNARGSLVAHLPLARNGVVGQQPIIPPRAEKCFEYASGTDLDTATGIQAGTLLVEKFDNGLEGAATGSMHCAVAPFALYTPPSKRHKEL